MSGARPPDGGPAGEPSAEEDPRGRAGRRAAALARVSLRLYPPSFRAEVGAGTVADVRRRAESVAAARGPAAATLWLPRLAVSLVLNAVGAWWDELSRGRRPRSGIALGGSVPRGPRISWLDVKLGSRMLVRYPGLTLVGSLAIAFAIWVGVGTFEFLSQVVFPTLPFDDGERVVGVRTWDAEASDYDPPPLHDFAGWRAELRSLTDLGAYRSVERNLITADGRGEPIVVAEMSATGFRVTRVPVLLGRTLVAADAEPGAPPVIVLGHDVWRRRFAGAPDVVGRVVRLGREQVTVVGVMPAGFRFPVAHTAWTPLRLNVLDYAWGESPAVNVFARLAPGFTLAEAQAELTAVGHRTAIDHPATHEHLRPRVEPYAKTILDLGTWMSLGVLSMNTFVIALLVLVCGNVALLMFARAATRESEIVVRNALGASRGRIVTQMFTEALVLAALASAVGLAAARFGLRWGMRVAEGQLGGLPFWFHGTLSPASLLYAVLLTILAAVVAGVVPGLKMTRGGLEGRLREHAAAGVRMGGLWTAVIIAQVAFTLFLPVMTFALQSELEGVRDRDVGFATEPYLSVRLEMDRDASPDTSRAAALARVRSTYEALERRLLDEPAIADVTFASNLPQRYHDWDIVEVDEGAVPPTDERGHRVGYAAIEPDYFEVLGIRMLAGRAFTRDDFAPEARVAIANGAFVETVLGGKNAVGRRVRYVAGERLPGFVQDSAWYRIVGVAPDLGMTGGQQGAGLYYPMALAATASPYVVMHVQGDAASFAPELQRVAAEVDPTLRLHDIVPLDRVDESDIRFYEFWFRLTGGLTLIALVLSWAGIYAVTSFTVSRRTREIGVRVALGGNARRVIPAVLRRPLAQVALGTALSALALCEIVGRASGLAFCAPGAHSAGCRQRRVEAEQRAGRCRPVSVGPSVS